MEQIAATQKCLTVVWNVTIMDPLVQCHVFSRSGPSEKLASRPFVTHCSLVL